MITVTVKLSNEFRLPSTRDSAAPIRAFTHKQQVAYGLVQSIGDVVCAALSEAVCRTIPDELISIEPETVSPQAKMRAQICIEVRIEIAGDTLQALAIRDEVATFVMRYLHINCPDPELTSMVTVEFAPVVGVIQQGMVVTHSWPGPPR